MSCASKQFEELTISTPVKSRRWVRLLLVTSGTTDVTTSMTEDTLLIFNSYKCSQLQFRSRVVFYWFITNLNLPSLCENEVIKIQQYFGVMFAIDM